jgi:hypothetical protein
MRRLLLATSILLVLLPAGGAIARDNAQDLLIDACRDERVDGTYSQATYRRALDQLPADSDQYTACRDVINRARLAALSNRSSSGNGSGGGSANSGGGGGSSSSAGGSGSGGGSASGGGSSGASSGGGASGSGGGSATSSGSTPGSVDVLDTATPTEQSAVKQAAQAGAAPVRVGGELLQPGAVGTLTNGHRDLPTSLLIALAALAACLLALGAAIGWNRVLIRRAR